MNARFVSVGMFTGLLILLACGKDNPQQPNTPPPKAKIDVTGYTATDEIGRPMGAIDTTDWREDVNWTSEEIQLFQMPTATELQNTDTANISLTPAFPNPITQSSNWIVRPTKTTLMQIVIVDSMLTVKDRYNMIISPNLISLRLNLNTPAYATGTNYRIYYGFYGPNKPLYFKGHGDIKVN